MSAALLVFTSIGVVAPWAPAPPAGAATSVVVTTTSDVVDAADGLISLREAAATAATDGDITDIRLTAGATYVLGCTTGGLDVQAPDLTTIRGSATTIRLAACPNEAVIESTGDIDLIGLVVRDGTAGGVRAPTRSVRLTDTTVTANSLIVQCTSVCGATGGGVLAGARFEAVRSIVSDNRVVTERCTSVCSAIGGNVSAREILMISSVISGGLASAGDVCASQCAARAGGIYGTVLVDVRQSTIHSNRAAVGDRCADICRAVGGGLVASDGDVRFDNTIIDSNVALAPTCATCSTLGGGVSVTLATVQAVHVTAVRNTAAEGANLALQALTATPYLLASAIGLGNGSPTATGCTVDPTPAISGGFNFFSGSAAGCAASTNDDLVSGGDPRLRSAGDGTRPRGSSPLWDAIPTARCATPVDRSSTTARPRGAGCDIGAVESGPVDANRFVALAPARLFDTRVDEPAPGPKGLVPAGGQIDVQVTGVAGVPAGATAVVLNVTATSSSGAGFVTVWPTGSPRPLASNLNLTGPGQTRPNSVTVPLGTGGQVSLFTLSGSHLLADVAGYYVAATDRQRAGRIVTLTPARVFDSRPSEIAPGPKGLVPAGGSVEVQITGLGGIPNTGVAAVVANITATEAVAGGFITAWPAGQVRPLASVLNLAAAGDTTPNMVIVPVGAAGRIMLYSQAGAHLIVDVTGYVTDATAPLDTEGLFVPAAPSRVFDTRPDEPAAGPKGRLGAAASVDMTVTGVAGVPAFASAVSVNVTATDTGPSGFVTAWPAGASRPTASTLNHSSRDTRANAAVLRLGSSGRVSLFSQQGAHLLVDTSGYFLD